MVIKLMIKIKLVKKVIMLGVKVINLLLGLYVVVELCIFEWWGDGDMRILLVDDYLVFCNGMMIMFGNLFDGVEIIEVGDVVVLVWEFEFEIKFDLVLFDFIFLGFDVL